MRGIVRSAVLFAALASFAAPRGSLESAPPKKELTEAEIREKLVAKPFLEGKLVDLETKADEKTFTLKVVWQVKTPNAEGQKKFRAVARGLMQRANDAIKNKNQQEFEKAKDEYLAAQAASYDVEETPLDFHLKGIADLKVRRQVLPEKEAGADGKPGKYTAAEIAALKGKDPTLPGYKAELTDLEEGGFVRVYLDKPKKATGPAPKDKPAEKEKPKEGDAAGEIYPTAVILITPDPTADSGNPFAK